MFQRGGAAHQINFILPSTEGNGKSLANPCPCPGGAGCGFAPACGGPCKRCCLPLLKMDEKKTVLRGVPGERSGCQCSVIRPVSYTHLDVYKRQYLERATSVTEYSDLEISIEIPPLGYLMFRLALSFSHIPSAGLSLIHI